MQASRRFFNQNLGHRLSLSGSLNGLPEKAFFFFLERESRFKEYWRGRFCNRRQLRPSQIFFYAFHYSLLLAHETTSIFRRGFFFSFAALKDLKAKNFHFETARRPIAEHFLTSLVRSVWNSPPQDSFSFFRAWVREHNLHQSGSKFRPLTVVRPIEKIIQEERTHLWFQPEKKD